MASGLWPSQPIATAPRNGKVIFLYTAKGKGAGTIAKAFWHQPATGRGIWAYFVPDHRLVHEVEYAPSHWALDPRAFSDAESTGIDLTQSA